jgi:dCTP diphosphatase
MKSFAQVRKKSVPIRGVEAQNFVGRVEAKKELTVIDNEKLALALRSFAAERDWDQFHTPKNLATSISVEAAELLELFQWSRGQKGWDEIEDASLRAKIEDELADILLYVIRFADKAAVDLQTIAERKIASNAAKYPTEKFRGSDRKYNESPL